MMVISAWGWLNASHSYAIDWSETYAWIEPAVSPDSGGSFEVKVAKGTGKRFIAVGITGLSEEENSGFLFGGEVVDRETRDVVDVSDNTELSVIYGARRFNNWGYIDAGIGLGYVTGNFANGCNVELDDRGLDQTVCSNIDQDSSAFSIPLELNAVFGHVYGIGVYFRVSFTTRGNQSSVGFTLPFGKFN